MKAKIGDKICILNIKCASWLDKGNIYTVEKIIGDELYFQGCKNVGWSHDPDDYEVIEQDLSAQNDYHEEMLEEAKRRFPVGTKHSGYDCKNPLEFIVTTQDFHWVEGNIYEKERSGCIYSPENGWAKSDYQEKQFIFNV